MVFKEQQEVSALLAFIFNTFINVLSTFKAIRQLIYNIPLGTHPMSNSGLILFMLCVTIAARYQTSGKRKTGWLAG